MKRAVLAIFLVLGLLPIAASANPIIADISNYRIDIDARFIGTRLFLFGSRNESGDVVVVIRSPEHDYTVRRKERVAGMWINRKYVTFSDLPDFYAVASSRPLSELNHTLLKEQLKIGNDNLFVVKESASRKLDIGEFEKAYLENRQIKRLYNASGELQFMGDSLFKTTFDFPDSITKGNYVAEVYLLKDDQLLGMQSLPLQVRTIGLEATIHDFAYKHSILYGILAIFLALSTGWVANHIFKRI